MNIIQRAWQAEPVAIVTVIGTVVLAVVEATMATGWSWQTVIIGGVGAVMGLTMRENVYSPLTVNKLASPESGEALDAEPSTSEIEPHGSETLDT